MRKSSRNFWISLQMQKCQKSKKWSALLWRSKNNKYFQNQIVFDPGRLAGWILRIQLFQWWTVLYLKDYSIQHLCKRFFEELNRWFPNFVEFIWDLCFPKWFEPVLLTQEYLLQSKDAYNDDLFASLHPVFVDFGFTWKENSSSLYLFYGL